MSLIGAGGMGEVYRARDIELGRDVALKFLPATFSDDAERAARFRREAQVLASLNHPHIAQIYGIEKTNGTSFLVLELIDGNDLARLLQRERLPVVNALRIARQITLALEAAHDKGIVHRDLKPANIALSRSGEVKILDFGLAKPINRDRDDGSGVDSPTMSASVATGAGVIIGTAAFMAPEQIKGTGADQRSDIWAFGCVLYEMLTGRRAFAGSDASETVAAILRDDPDWTRLPAECPLPIRRLLRRCLRKNRDDRLAHIADARLEIDAAEATSADGEEIARRPLTTVIARAVAPLALAVSAVGVLLVVGLRNQSSSAAGHSAVVRFTAEHNQLIPNWYPAFALSPQGRVLISSTSPTLNRARSLQMRRLDRPGFETIPGTDGSVSPAFLDEHRLLFLEGNSRDLKVIDLESGAIEILTRLPWDHIAGAALGPDNTIVLASRAGNEHPYVLQRVPLSGGEAVTVTAPDKTSNETGFMWPQVLPDLRHVLLTVESKTNQYRVDLLDLRTLRRRTVIENAFAARYVEPGVLVFFRPASTGADVLNGDLVALPFELSTFQAAGNPTTLIAGIQSGLAYNGRGIDVALSSDTLAAMPSRIPPAARSLAWVSEGAGVSPIDVQHGAYRQPAMSPDGTRLALGVDNNGGMWIFDIPREILTGFRRPGFSETPQWSPDGKLIAFHGVRDGRSCVVTANPDDAQSEEIRWCFGNHLHVNGWSPDGTLIYANVRSNVGNEDLWGYSLPERRARPLAATAAREQNAAPSPDGQWFAYVSDESGRPEVYVQQLSGSRRLQVSKAGGTQPVWFRDGTLYFRALTGDLWAVKPVLSAPDLRLPAPAFVIKLPAPINIDDREPRFAVSHDAKRFLVIRDETPPRRSVIDITLNWRSELTILRP